MLNRLDYKLISYASVFRSAPIKENLSLLNSLSQLKKYSEVSDLFLWNNFQIILIVEEFNLVNINNNIEDKYNILAIFLR